MADNPMFRLKSVEVSMPFLGDRKVDVLKHMDDLPDLREAVRLLRKCYGHATTFTVTICGENVKKVDP